MPAAPSLTRELVMAWPLLSAPQPTNASALLALRSMKEYAHVLKETR